MTSTLKQLPARHIQNFSEAQTLVPHWGYAERALPCTNDPGSCEYLDTVYHAHDVSMLYSFILWAVIGAILCFWAIYYRTKLTRKSSLSRAGDENNTIKTQSYLYRLTRSIAATTNRYLLQDAFRPIFGRVTRLQVLVLLTLTGYLAIFTFVGIVYKKWVTPVKNNPGVYNTRTGLGPWSDRIGVLAFALTPLSVLLSSRESLLSLITGVPYQSFNFMHRWLGYIIFVQSAFHTIGWTVVEAKLYQPQPKVWNAFISQTYMIWGVVAMIFLSFLFVFSTPWAIRKTGYEFFRKAHYIVAMLYIGACWGHWQQLSCWMIASLVVWFLDRTIRLIRTALLHYGYIPGSTTSMGFSTISAQISHFPDPDHGDVVRLDFEHNHDAWDVGQHFYLCFPQLSIWQSHPFTPSTRPASGMGLQTHTYVMRSKNGETNKIAALAAAKSNLVSEKNHSLASPQATTSVILSGPYGKSTISSLDSTDVNVLCIAGGTGITFIMPVLLHLISQPIPSPSPCSDSGGCPRRKVELIWVVRRREDLKWMRKELDVLRDAERCIDLSIKIFVTRNDKSHIPASAQPTNTKSEKMESSFIRIEEKSTLSSTSSSSSSSSTTAAKLTENCCGCTDTITPSDDKPSQSSPDESCGIPTFEVQQTTLSTSDAEITASQRRPDLSQLTKEFIDNTIAGPISVYASGPGGMISDLRSIVARCNDGKKVLRGEERFDVRLICDDRFEW